MNFMTPYVKGNFRVKSVNLMYFLEYLLPFFGAWFRQTK